MPKQQLRHPLEASLYRRVESSSPHYLRRQRKVLNVQRLLADQPCWLDERPDVIELPKTLILADWTITIGSQESRNKKKAYLVELLRGDRGHAFDAWVCHDDGLVPLTLETIDRFFEYDLPVKGKRKEAQKTHHAIKPTALPTIKAAMTTKNLSQDACLIIDYVVMEQLLTGERVASAVSFESVVAWHEHQVRIEGGMVVWKARARAVRVDKILGVVESFYPDQDVPVVLHECSAFTLEAWRAAKKGYEGEVEGRFLKAIDTLNFRFSNKKRYSIESGYFIINEWASIPLKNLRKVTLSKQKDFSVLNLAPNCKELTILEGAPDDFDPVACVALFNSEIIHLEKVTINKAWITALGMKLKKSCNVKSLTLKDCTISKRDAEEMCQFYSPDSDVQASLERLVLIDNTGDGVSVLCQTLFRFASNVSDLVVLQDIATHEGAPAGGGGAAADAPADIPSLTQLRSLVCYGDFIRAFRGDLSHLPALETLTVKLTDGVGDDVGFEICSASDTLRVLSLEGRGRERAPWWSGSFGRTMSSLPQLSSLFMSRLSIISAEERDPFARNNLRYCVLDDVRIRSGVFVEFFQVSPRLESLVMLLVDITSKYGRNTFSTHVEASKQWSFPQMSYLEMSCDQPEDLLILAAAWNASPYLAACRLKLSYLHELSRMPGLVVQPSRSLKQAEIVFPLYSDSSRAPVRGAAIQQWSTQLFESMPAVEKLTVTNIDGSLVHENRLREGVLSQLKTVRLKGDLMRSLCVLLEHASPEELVLESDRSHSVAVEHSSQITLSFGSLKRLIFRDEAVSSCVWDSVMTGGLIHGVPDGELSLEEWRVDVPLQTCHERAVLERLVQLLKNYSCPHLRHLQVGEALFVDAALTFAEFKALFPNFEMTLLPLSESDRDQLDRDRSCSQAAAGGGVKVDERLKRIRFAVQDPHHQPAASAADVEPHAVLEDGVPARSGRAEATVDASTAPSMTPRSVKRIYAFDGADPKTSFYRQTFYDCLTINPNVCSAHHVFRLSCSEWHPSGADIKEIPAREGSLEAVGYLLKQQHPDQRYFYVKDKLRLSNRWIPLLSISPEDSIDYLTVHSEQSYQVAFHPMYRCYMIRSLGRAAQTVVLDYVFHQPRSLPRPRPANPQEREDLAGIQVLVREMNAYRAGALPLEEGMTGIEVVELMKQQKRGACRHRSAVFKSIMDERYPQYPTRYISSGLHAFVEVTIGGCVATFDLGGYGNPNPAPELEAVADDQFERFRSELVEDVEAGVAEALAADADRAPVVAAEQQACAEGLRSESEVVAAAALESEEMAADPDLVAEPVSDPEPQYEEVEQELPISEETKKAYLLESYRPMFEPSAEPARSQEERMRAFIENPGENHLFRSYSQKEHEGVVLVWYALAKQAGHPVFWVRGPEDLTLHVGLIKEADNTGRRTQEACGPLHDFLSALPDHGPTPVLLIDFSRFTQHDIIRANSLSDETRKLGETTLPAHLSIIGCQDMSQPDPYDGADLRRRYQLHEKHRIRRYTDGAVIDQRLADPEVERVSIDLYHSAMDAEQRLLGRWGLNRESFLYRDGPLMQAVRMAADEQPRIEIINAPVGHATYRLFWEKIALDGEIDGVPIDVNRITHDPEPQYEQVNDLVAEDMPFDGAEPNRHDLNPELLPNFFVHYSEEGHLLEAQPGVLQAAADAGQKAVSVLVSHPLKRSQWAELLDKASELRIDLDVRTLPGVPAILPEGDELLVPVEYPVQHFDSASNNPFIVSGDIDETVRQLITQNDSHQVLDVSELEGTDLFSVIDASVTPEKLHFTQKKQAILRLLEETDQTIIVTGYFSDAVVGAILPYIRQYPNRLFCVTDSPDSFGRFGCQTHAVPAPVVDVRAFVRLDDAGMLSVQPFSGPEAAEAASHDFFEERQQLINDALDAHPYVFISGVTGVGKSTFMAKYFPDALWGEEHLSDWADNPAGGVLFLDEANISQCQWTVFEGLFQTPQSILIDGEIKQLTEHHKVVFAGNPLKAGGERQLARLFQRHGHAVIFQPLTADVIYHEILRPIAVGTVLEDRLDEIATPLLAAYNAMVSLSGDRILVTPRQLKLIMMMVISTCEAAAGSDPLTVLNEKARAVLLPLLDERNQPCLDEIFPVQDLPVDNPPIERLGDGFWLTASRRPALDRLQDLLRIRDYQKRHHESGDLNPDQARGGICALVLEGMPGTGKTQLLQALMQAMGFVEARYDAAGKLRPGHPFNTYHMVPATLSMEEKINRFVQAARFGHVVVGDEYNASPMLEDKTNELLMGSYQGVPLQHPGAVFLFTQNPASLGYRRKASTAQEKRMMTVKVPEYSREEMMAIADKLYGIPRLHAGVLVELFERKRRLDPASGLTFSCLLKRLAMCAPRVAAVEASIQQTERVMRRIMVQRPAASAAAAAADPGVGSDDDSDAPPSVADMLAEQRHRAAEEAERRRQAEAAAQERRHQEEAAERRRQAEAAAQAKQSHSEDTEQQQALSEEAIPAKRCDSSLLVLSLGASVGYAGFVAATTMSALQLVSAFSGVAVTSSASLFSTLSAHPLGAVFGGIGVFLLVAAAVLTSLSVKRGRYVRSHLLGKRVAGKTADPEAGPTHSS